MNKKIHPQKKLKASDANQPKIVMVPIDKIKPCRWGTGIRDHEKYELLKKNIEIHGLNNPLKVRPIRNGYFETFMGDHRLMGCKELKWKEVQCIIENINDKVARERCVSDNITGTKYNSVQLENIVFEIWNSKQYQSKQQLGDAIGLTGQRIGQLLGAKEIRDKSKVPFDERISTQCILDTSSLQNDDEKIVLLKLVIDGIRKPSEVKEYAEFLSKASDEAKKLIFRGVPLEKITDHQPKTKLSKSRKITITAPTIDLPEIYKVLSGLQDHIALIKDPEKKNESLNYIKFYAGLFLQILWKEGAIHRDYFESAVRHELKIDEGQLHHFDGLMTLGVDYWLKDLGNLDTDEEEDTQ